MIPDVENCLDFGELRKPLLFANTPIYLYSRFRKDPSVQRLGTRHTASDLLDCLETTLAEGATDLKTAVKAYALMVSLSFKPASELRRLKHLSSENFQWFAWMKQIVLSDAPKIVWSQVKIETKPKIRSQQELELTSRSGIAQNSRKLVLPEQVHK